MYVHFILVFNNGYVDIMGIQCIFNELSTVVNWTFDKCWLI